MNNLKIKAKNLINKFKESDNKFLSYVKHPLLTRKNTVISFLLIVLTVICIVFFSSLDRGGFYNYSTDDILQNYPFMESFVEDLKSGNLHLFDRNMLVGQSQAANAFYIPIDIFTFLVVVLSFFMNIEIAYSLINMLVPVCGALILMKVFFNKNYKNKTVFIGALIFVYGGMSQAYMVWPTFNELSFYAPLAMLVAETFLKDKKKWYLVPLFGLAVVLYNFYFAYMIFAFFMIYMFMMLFVSGKVDAVGKKGFYKNGEFWFYLVSSLCLLILGLGMGMTTFLPSMLYQLTETAPKSTDTFSLWKFPRTGHYFTIFIDLFFPSDPHNLMLGQAGDYVREHISLYMTTYGFVFLLYFFTKKGKQNRKLQFFILLFNILALFPLTSIILSAHTNAYVRWFFILYLINFSGMMKGLDMDSGQMKVKPVPFVLMEIVLLIGTAAFLIVLFGNIYAAHWLTSESNYSHQIAYGQFSGYGSTYNDLLPGFNLSIHLKPDDELYLPMMIVGIVVTLLYAAQLFLFKFKNLYKIMYIYLALELIGSAVAIFSYIPAVNKYYLDDKAYLEHAGTELEDNSNYDKDSVFKVVFDDTSTRSRSNSSKMEPNFNQGAFFHSFYDASLDDFLKDVTNNTQNWSKRESGIYNPIGNYLFNNKYMITNKGYSESDKPYDQEIYMNEAIFKKVYESPAKFKFRINEYYEVTDMPSAIVYDSYFNAKANYGFSSTETIQNMSNLLEHAYFSYDKEEEKSVNPFSSFFNKDESDDNLDKEPTTYSSSQLDLFDEYNLINDSSISNYIYSTYISNTEKDVKFGTSNHSYNVYNFDSESDSFKNTVLANENMYIYIGDKTRTASWEELFVVDTDGNVHNMFYNNLFREPGSTWIPDKLYIKIQDNRTPFVKASFYSNDVITDFIDRQSVYDTSMTINNSTLNIKTSLPSRAEGYIIKTPYTYSQDWIVDDDSSIKTINVDGGFLGILVKGDAGNVDVHISYVPAGLHTGIIVSVISIVCFSGMIVLIIIYKKKDKRTDIEKEIDIDIKDTLTLYT